MEDFFDKLAQNQLHYEQLWDLLLIFTSLIGVILLHFILRKLLIKITSRIAQRTETEWDDWLIQEKFFHHLVGFIPLGLVRYFENTIREINEGAGKITHVVVQMIAIWFATHLITSINRVVVKYAEKRGKQNIIAVTNLIQFANIMIYVFGSILGISVLLNLDLNTIFTGLSAITAVVILIFKDTITGFISSLQIANSNIVKIGHWITLDAYNADGVVEKINLFNTRIRNFDKTIVTIPTSAIMQGSMKNWNAMAQSNTRRIKRSILLDVNSFRFLTQEDFARLSELPLLKEYVATHLNTSDESLDKKPTNVGALRHYLEYYLASRPDISPVSKDTTLVRQLEMTTQGLPLQVYCFTTSSVWREYERIQSDLFEHVLTVVSLFDLRLYQQYDFSMKNSKS